MNLFDAMRAFIEIVDRGSMTAAAEALGRSQPAIARTLAALEARVGARLLNRTTRRMSLTPEGRDYLARCRSILADVEEAELAAGRHQVEPRGELRITAPVLFGRLHVAPALTEFLRRYPELRAELLLFDRNVDLVEEGIDLAVRIGELPDSTLLAVPVRRVRRVICASPTLLAEVGRPTHPEDLGNLPCILFTGLAPGSDWQFREDERRFTVHVSGNLRSNHLEVARDACLGGMGFGRFLSYQVAPLLEAGELETVLEEYQPLPLPVSLVYPASRLAPARLRLLIDWLRYALAEQRGQFVKREIAGQDSQGRRP